MALIESTPSSTLINDTNSTPRVAERSLKEGLDNLQMQLVLLEREGGMDGDVQGFVAAMHRVGDSHPDPRVKKAWHRKAQDFLRAAPNKRKNMLHDIGKGLLIVLAAPLLLAGAAIFGVGGTLYGGGLMIKGLGNVMTGGFFERDDKKSQRT